MKKISIFILLLSFILFLLLISNVFSKQIPINKSSKNSIRTQRDNQKLFLKSFKETAQIIEEDRRQREKHLAKQNPKTVPYKYNHDVTPDMEKEEKIHFLLNDDENELLGVKVLPNLQEEAYDFDTPVHLHVAFTGNPSEIAISWKTLQPQPTYCKYGLQPGQYNFTTEGKQHTYFYQVGYFHDVILKNLQPYTIYYYTCGYGSQESNPLNWSPEFSFLTQPPAITEADKITRPDGASTGYKFAVFGDMGVANADNVTELLYNMYLNKSYDVVIHVGDISYADDYVPSLYEFTWDLWFTNIEKVSANVPYMVCPGNHEFPYNFTVYKERFRMPGQESKSHTNMFYSYDYGNIHFISLSTEPAYPKHFAIGSQQYTWLENDLIKANQNRDKVPWIIIYAHRPLYCSGNYIDCEIVASLLRDGWEDLFQQYNVDLGMFGHIHGYERTYPIYKGKVLAKNYNSPSNIFYLNPGSGGNNEGFTVWNTYEPGWSAFRASEWGFGILNVINNTMLTWEFYNAATNTVVDSLVLTKN